MIKLNTCIFLKGPANSVVFAGISLLFSSHTKQLSNATVWGTDKSLNTPLNINSVISNSSALIHKIWVKNSLKSKMNNCYYDYNLPAQFTRYTSFSFDNFSSSTISHSSQYTFTTFEIIHLHERLSFLQFSFRF